MNNLLQKELIKGIGKLLLTSMSNGKSVSISNGNLISAQIRMNIGKAGVILGMVLSCTSIKKPIVRGGIRC